MRRVADDRNRARRFDGMGSKKARRDRDGVSKGERKSVLDVESSFFFSIFSLLLLDDDDFDDDR